MKRGYDANDFDAEFGRKRLGLEVGRAVDNAPRGAARLSNEPNACLVRAEDAEPQPIARDRESGADILADVEAFLSRFIAYPSEHDRVAHTLWIAHTHAMRAWESTPRLAFLSPEPASGKTRALEVTATLVPNAVEAANVTPAYLFRKVGSGACTVLFDEIDTIFGSKPREASEELRAFINAGHRRGATVGRCVPKGRKIEPEDWPAYCAVALAGLGDLPDTILSRSIVVRMRRRAPSERVEPYRARVHTQEGNKIRERLSRWATRHIELLERARPPMPEGVDDRDADCWESLLAIADAAGSDWPKRAREAAQYKVAEAKSDTPSLGVRLLADLRTIFDDRDAMATAEIIDRLLALEEGPWAEINHGKPINARGLARLLKPYGIASKTIRRDGCGTAKGYRREDFEDAWARYLSPYPGKSVTSVTSVTPSENAREIKDLDHTSSLRFSGDVTARSVTATGDVTARSVTASEIRNKKASQNQVLSANVTDVTHVTHFRDNGEQGTMDDDWPDGEEEEWTG